MSDELRQRGMLDVQVDSQSMLLNDSLPLEIRDGHHALVEELTRAGQVELLPGLYSVTALLEDGRLHKQVIQVRSGKTTQVLFRHAAAPGSQRDASPSAATPPLELTRGGMPKDVDAQPAELEELSGAVITSVSAGRWVVVPQGSLEAVPHARLRIGDRTVRVSLPVNPVDQYPRNACTIEVTTRGKRPSVRVLLAPERVVASAVLGMMASGQVVRGAEVAQRAAELLADKYLDPVGAALGGLLLHRLGLLEAYESWVGRLANTFGWLPDGRILLGALLVRSEDESRRAEGLDILLSAGHQRLMFADALSALLAVLRRWPGNARAEERATLLSEVGGIAASVDWSEAVLTECLEGCSPRPTLGTSRYDDLSRVTPGNQRRLTSSHSRKGADHVLELRALPARQGDALWIRWGDDPVYQMLVDMGTGQVGSALRSRLQGLDRGARRFELLVATHVDSDHIGGLLTCLAEVDPMPGLEIGDIWFNGWEHLHGRSVGTERRPSELEAFGPAEGERLSTWLLSQHWNRAFGGGPVRRVPETPLPTIELAGGLKLTVLGPTPRRLEELQATWKDEVEKAIREGRLGSISHDLEPYGALRLPELESEDDLAALADSAPSRDDSKANGASIVLLLEYEGARILLAGDAYADDLVEGLQEAGHDRPVKLDAFKLPHHGSKSNVTDALVRAVECPLWLFSTDGTQHRHPDAPAVARVVRSSRVESPVLAFNVKSPYNELWDNADWKTRFRYRTLFGPAEGGLAARFPLSG